MSAPADRASSSEIHAARRLDAAIDELLAGRSEGSKEHGSLEETAFVLGSRLPRLHPRFGFEERLAQRLRAEATGGSTAPRGSAAAPTAMAAGSGASSVLAFPGPGRPSPDLAARERAWHPGRWSLIGAIASGLSLLVTLLGAGFVIRRRGRGADTTESLA